MHKIQKNVKCRLCSVFSAVTSSFRIPSKDKIRQTLEKSPKFIYDYEIKFDYFNLLQNKTN